MARPSKIKRAKASIKEAIGEWRQAGRTLAEIVDDLEEVFGVKFSRSAVHRHVQGMEKALERIQRSRDVAEATVRAFGKEPDSRVTRANIELMHAAVQEIMMQGDSVDAEGNLMPGAVAKPMDAMLMAKAIEHLAKASKSDADFIAKVRDEAARLAVKEASAAVAELGKEKGLSRETVLEIQEKILGVRLPSKDGEKA